MILGGLNIVGMKESVSGCEREILQTGGVKKQVNDKMEGIYKNQLFFKIY